MEKTNVMRVLDQKKIPYTPFEYTADASLSGVAVANLIGVPTGSAFKTLVAVGKSGRHYVFDIPVDRELDLKKAAAAVGEKNVAMVKAKELLGLTGYVHGGCSPIGMKKFFQTTFDVSVSEKDTIYFSAGKVGAFVGIKKDDLIKVIPHAVADITE